MKSNYHVIKKISISLCLFIVSTFIYAESPNKTFKVSIVAENLKFPWSIVFLPNTDILVTERGGSLRVIRNGELLDKKISGLPDIYVEGQAGLFDIVLDPNFTTNKKLYISYSGGTKSNNFVAVSSAILRGMSLQQTKMIYIGTSRNTPNNHGARMAFLPDGTLLITTGDGFNFREKAQFLNNMLGKVIRINTDGSIPKDNPFVDHKNTRPEVYSYGHRNPQAIVVTKARKMWLHEHGPRGGDELNLIESGYNYGWPAITYGIDYSGALISPFTKAVGMEQPVAYWVPSIAPAGMTEYQGNIFPQWQGNLFIASLAEQSIRRLSLKNNKVLAQEIMLTEREQRFRDIRTSPDGYIYILTDSEQGQLLRLSPN